MPGDGQQQHMLPMGVGEPQKPSAKGTLKLRPNRCPKVGQGKGGGGIPGRGESMCEDPEAVTN